VLRQAEGRFRTGEGDVDADGSRAVLGPIGVPTEGLLQTVFTSLLEVLFNFFGAVLEAREAVLPVARNF
jgi:hypothetical protein